MLAHAYQLEPGSGRVVELDPAEVLANPKRQGLLWLDWLDVDTPDVVWLAEHYQFHHLALEDCLKAGQRPKIEHYEGYAFLDLYAARMAPGKNTLQLDEIDLFLGDGYLMTVHKAPVPALYEVLERWRQSREAPTEGAGYLLYLLLDTLVDAYFPVVDRLEERLEASEDELFGHFNERVVARIFHLKKELLQFRKVVSPTRDVCLMLLRRETQLITPATVVYLQDVYDHLIRVTDSIDTYRDLVSGAIEAYLSVVANRTNDTMKRLTSTATILMSVTLVASIYGMNLQMPEAHWRYGYEFALGLMIVIALGLSLLFKARRYF